MFAAYAALFCLVGSGPIARADDPPKGEVTQHTFARSQIFPGTTRDYWIYVPAQYDPEKPACVYVNQDGIQYNAPEVFDRLIAAGEMPVTIGVFVRPGVVPAPREDALDRFNRSVEYDGLGDAYARFLLEELLPDVETKTTSDGRPIRLSKSGNDRAIGGASSGAICAFTAAWERPDAFTRVFSAIGTYVGLRGGNDYPTWIRKFEPKPIRIFLEDGENDLNIYGGDWWMANQEMERALRFAGYEVEHAWGTGGHDTKHATEVFPDAMRFLWKGWPEPVKAGRGSPQLREIVEPGSGWERLVKGDEEIRGLFALPDGSIVYRTFKVPPILNRPPGSGRPPRDEKLFRIAPDGTPLGRVETTMTPGELVCFGPDGRAYGLEENQGLYVCDLNGSNRVELYPRAGTPVAVLHDGTVLAREPRRQFFDPDQIVTLRSGKEPTTASLTPGFTPSRWALSPDRSLLYMSVMAFYGADGSDVYSAQLEPSGAVRHFQPFFKLEPLLVDRPGALDLAVDRDGRLYAAAIRGVQVCDQAGRVNVILPLPYSPPVVRESDPSRGITLLMSALSDGLAFGGPDHDTLYVSRGGELWRRKLKVSGAPAFLPPSKPKAPRL